MYLQSLGLEQTFAAIENYKIVVLYLLIKYSIAVRTEL